MKNKIMFWRIISLIIVIIAAYILARYSVLNNSYYYDTLNYYQDSIATNTSINDTFKINKVDIAINKSILYYKKYKTVDYYCIRYLNTANINDATFNYIIKKLIKNGYYQIAKRFLEYNDSMEDSALYYKGLVYFYNKSFDTAHSYFLESIKKISIPNQKAYEGLILLYNYPSKTKIAYKYITEDYNKYPDDSICIYAYSLMKFKQKNFNNAKKTLLKSIHKFKHFDSLYILLARTYQQQNNYDSAKFYYQYVIDSINPENIYAIKALINTTINSSDTTEKNKALQYIDKHYEKDSSVEFLYQAGVIYLEKQQYDNAIASFAEYNQEAEIKDLPNKDASLYYEAYCWHIFGNDDRAKELIYKINSNNLTKELKNKKDSLLRILVY